MTLPEPQKAERLKEIAARVERIVPRSSLDEEVVALYVNDVRWLLAQNTELSDALINILTLVKQDTPWPITNVALLAARAVLDTRGK